MTQNNLWFHGPYWLLLPRDKWPEIDIKSATRTDLKEKTRVNLISTPIHETGILLRFSTLTRLLRVTSYILRFIHGSCRKETLNYTDEFLTVSELRRAKSTWTKYAQILYFSREIESIRKRGYVMKEVI